MKKSKSWFILPLLMLSLTLGACSIDAGSSSEPNSTETDSRYEIYLLAQDSGYTGTYEEWLTSIRGADGASLLSGTSDPTSEAGKDGDTFVNTSTWDVFVKSGGNWAKVGNVLGQKGDKGDTGEQGPAGEDGVSVVSIEKTSSEGFIDTYTITYSDGTTSTFTVTNGIDGQQGIQGIPGQDGHTPVITISEDGYWVVDGIQTSTLAQGPKGDKGDQGEPGQTPYIGENGNWWIGETDTGVDASQDTYTVTFDPNNGEATFTQPVLENKKATKPTNPSKPGYVFDGWYANSDELWVFAGFPVTEDMTLTAKYTLGIFTVSLNANGGTFDGPTSLSFTYTGDYSLPEPTKFGNRFAGWKDTENNTVPLTGKYNHIKDLSLTAQWDALYVVTFDSNGGSVCDPIYKFDYEAIATLPAPEKDSAIFMGWFFGGTKIEAPYIPENNQSVTLSAHWKLASADFTYQLINGDTEVEILSYTGTGTEVIIPNTISSLPVASIGANAFLNNTSVASVTAGTNLLSIGTNSFNGCTALKKINSPGLNALGENAFLGCATLESFSLGKPTFALLMAFNYDEGNLPTSFTTIKINQNFTNTNISNLFKSISAHLFNVSMGIEITSFSFKNCKILNSISFDENAMITEIGFEAFSGCSNFKSIIIPGSVISIGVYAFSSCSSLTSIVVPNTVISIGEGAFSSCISLSSIVLPDGLAVINSNTFNYCPALKYIVIPNGVTSIGNHAFSQCALLNTVVIPRSVTLISSYAFSYFGSVSQVYYGGTQSDWFNFVNIESNNDPLTNAPITYLSTFSSCKRLNDGTFLYYLFDEARVVIERCLDSTIESINLENYFEGKIVVSISPGAFSNCPSLTSIIIPNSVTLISDYAFSSCTSLTSIIIPDGVTSIGMSAFFSCTSLTSIILPDSLTSIGDGGVYGCTSLTSIIIPNSVTTIGISAFAGCINLTIYCEAASLPVGWDALWNYSNLPVVWGYVG